MYKIGDEIRLSPILHAVKKGQYTYSIIFSNGVNLGEIVQDVDGFYKYWPKSRGGYWEAEPLRAIAALLDHLDHIEESEGV